MLTRNESFSAYTAQQKIFRGTVTEAYNMAGDGIAWAEAGLPFETGPLSSLVLPPWASSWRHGTINGTTELL